MRHLYQASALPALLNVREVSHVLKVSTATVYTLVARGELTHVRVLNAIRVAPADLSAFIASNRSTP